MKFKILLIIKIVVFIVCLSLIIFYQKTAGKFELGMMLIGLAGLLGLLRMTTIENTYKLTRASELIKESHIYVQR